MEGLVSPTSLELKRREAKKIRMYTKRARTRGETIAQKIATPLEGHILMVSKLPTLYKCYKVKDLKKIKNKDLRKLRQENGNPHNGKRTSIDKRFWTSFQQDYY